MLLMIVKLAMKSCLKLVEFWYGHKARIIAKKKKKKNSNGSIVALYAKWSRKKGKQFTKSESFASFMFLAKSSNSLANIYIFVNKQV
jgi:hypothetical protein